MDEPMAARTSCETASSTVDPEGVFMVRVQKRDQAQVMRIKELQERPREFLYFCI
jgi:hypothetical protein